MFVQGRVVFDDGRPFPPIFPNLYIHVKGQRGVNTVGEDGIRIRGSGSFGATPVGKDGTFTLVLQDGEHELALVTGLGDPLSRADGYYVTSMVSGAKDILREKLVVENRTALPITITLAPFKTPGK